MLIVFQIQTKRSHTMHSYRSVELEGDFEEDGLPLTEIIPDNDDLEIERAFSNELHATDDSLDATDDDEEKTLLGLGIPTSDEAKIFFHPRRNPQFPPIYELYHPHPMRNKNLTAKACPRADQNGFRDFVVIVEKTAEYMVNWYKFAEGLKVQPDENIAREEGTFFIHVRTNSANSTFRVASTTGRRCAMDS
jgi:hypothetical protein